MKIATVTKKKITVFVLLALLVAAVAIFPLVDSNTYHQLILGEALVNIIVVLGLNFITGLTGQMNLGTAGIMALGAYGSVLLRVKVGVPSLLTLLVAIAFGLIIGLALGYPSLRLKGVYLSLTTIGFSEVIRLLIANLVDLTNGTNGIKDIPPMNLFGLKMTSTRMVIWFYLVLVILLTFTAWRVVHSKWGRVFKAVRDNVEAVEASGVNIASIKIQAFTLAAIYGCIGGCLYAFLVGYVNPSQFTQDLSANYLLMMMFGGIGSVPGCIIGATTITVLPELLRFLKSYYWLVFGIITLLFAIFLPYGVVSLFEHNGPVARGVKKLLAKKEAAHHDD